MKDKIVEILIEVAKEVYITAASGFRGSTEYNFKRLNKYAAKIARLYSAGEEVSEENIKRILLSSLSVSKDEPRRILGKVKAIRSLYKLLTRPTVSEGEIVDVLDNELYLTPRSDSYISGKYDAAKAIKELLNR